MFCYFIQTFNKFKLYQDNTANQDKFGQDNCGMDYPYCPTTSVNTTRELGSLKRLEYELNIYKNHILVCVIIKYLVVRETAVRS